MGKEPAIAARPLQAPRHPRSPATRKQDIFATATAIGTFRDGRMEMAPKILVRRARRGRSPRCMEGQGTMRRFAAEDGDAGLLEL